MRLRVRAIDLFVQNLRARHPFRFGVATITWAPLCTARLRLEAEDGTSAVGHAADLLMPKWFDKDPAKDPVDNVRDLAASARGAADALLAQPEHTAFDLWRRVYGERVGSRPTDAPDRLVRGFGVALVERALLDAACRAAGLSFFDALTRDLFGFRPGAVHPPLGAWDWRGSLGPRPRDSVRLRHTIGLADAPTAEELRGPGLTSFKVKLGGDPDADRDRLSDLAGFLRSVVGEGLELSVDANEQYADLGQLAGVLDAVGADPDGAWLLERLLFVEQPLPRARSFEPGLAEGFARLGVPAALDEADHGLEAFPRALEVGWRGVSAKNCKGVFRSLLNRGLCEAHGAAHPEDAAFQTAEDLTNLPVLALQQDLATVAALGLEHVERNGHHYFPGLAHLTPGEREDALAHHGDLYTEEDGGRLRIEGGRLEIGSLQGVGYGHRVGIEADAPPRGPLAAWRPPVPVEPPPASR